MKHFINAFLLLLPFGLCAQPLREGDTLEALRFKDQFEKEFGITAQTKQLMVVFSKIEGEKVKAFLETHPNYLQENNALYLMDVTPVPSMVMCMFMLPKFKKYAYPIGLIEDETILKTFPKKEKFITLMTLDNLKITAIEFKEAL